MVVSFEGTVRQAVEIDSIEPATGGTRSGNRSNRSVVHGSILRAGHPVFDKYVGKTSPVQGMRNPVTYFEDEADGQPCRCERGGSVSGRDFLPGHDQRDPRPHQPDRHGLRVPRLVRHRAGTQARQLTSRSPTTS
jgi:hypothetical protein